MHSAIIVADLNGRIFQWLDRSGPLLTRSGGKPRRWPPTASPKRTLRACSASRSRPIAGVASGLPLGFQGGFPRNLLSEFRIAGLLLGFQRGLASGSLGGLRSG